MAWLRLDNHKQSAYIFQERDALLKFDNKKLMKEAHVGLLNCAKNSLAFIEIPKEMTERLLEQGLMRSESKYYDVLQKKQSLMGFHPFKRMALNRALKRTAKEYNDGIALLSDTRENKLKHPPLTTLDEWKKQNSVPIEKIADAIEELTDEFPVEVIEEETKEKKINQLDLGDKIHARKTDTHSVPEKETKKDVCEIAEKDI